MGAPVLTQHRATEDKAADTMMLLGHKSFFSFCIFSTILVIGGREAMGAAIQGQGNTTKYAADYYYSDNNGAGRRSHTKYFFPFLQIFLQVQMPRTNMKTTLGTLRTVGDRTTPRRRRK